MSLLPQQPTRCARMVMLGTLLAGLAPPALQAMQVPRTRAAVARAESTIVAAHLLRDIGTLASDRFEGRAPGTQGEDSAVAYIAGEFQRLGLRPGNPNGTWIQRVPLVGTTSTVEARLSHAGGTLALRPLDDMVAWSLRPDTLVSVPPSEMVFLGYGVTAPEFAWDDFKGVDVRGKTVVMLVAIPRCPIRAIPPASIRRCSAAGR